MIPPTGIDQRFLKISSFGVHYSLSPRERAGVRGSAKLML